jgi:hypothetical protein
MMTVSTAGFFIRGGVFFAGLRLVLALATVFACARLRAVTRLAELPFRAFARFWIFDAFLRLAMIDPPPVWWRQIKGQSAKPRQLISWVINNRLVLARPRDWLLHPAC